MTPWDDYFEEKYQHGEEMMASLKRRAKECQLRRRKYDEDCMSLAHASHCMTEDFEEKKTDEAT